MSEDPSPPGESASSGPAGAPTDPSGLTGSPPTFDPSGWAQAMADAIAKAYPAADADTLRIGHQLEELMANFNPWVKPPGEAAGSELPESSPDSSALPSSPPTFDPSGWAKAMADAIADANLGSEVDGQRMSQMFDELMANYNPWVKADPPAPASRPGIPKKFLAAAGATVTAVVIVSGLLITHSGGGTNKASTVPTAQASIPDKTKFAMDMVSTEAVIGQAPIPSRYDPPMTVGEHIQGTLTFQGTCTPEHCVARFRCVCIDKPYDYNLTNTFAAAFPPNGDVTLNYKDGAYTASASMQMGCAGLPPTNGESMSLGTASLSFKVVGSKTGGSGSVASRIAGTISDHYDHPFNFRYYPPLPDGRFDTFYCPNYWGTLSFTGVAS